MDRSSVIRALGALSLVSATGFPATGATPTVLHIGTTGKETDAQAPYAQASGAFERAGLQVDIQVLPNGAAIAAAIAGGSLQLGNSNVLTIAKAHEKGLPFELVALSAQYNDAFPATVLAAAPDSGIRTGKDLNGKILGGVSLGGLDQLSMQIWIDQNGGDSSTVKFIELRPSEIVPALLRGTIAAGNLSEPELTGQRSKVRILGKSYGAVARTFAQTGWFANRTWVNTNPAIARAFALALVQGADWASDPAHRAEAGVVLAKFAKTDTAIARSEFARTLDPALVQPVLDGGLKYHLLDHAVSAAELFAPELNLRRAQ